MIAIVLPPIARQRAGTGMQATLIRRHDEHPLPFSKLRKTFDKQIMQLLHRYVAFAAALRAVEAHTVCLNPQLVQARNVDALSRINLLVSASGMLPHSR